MWDWDIESLHEFAMALGSKAWSEVEFESLDLVLKLILPFTLNLKATRKKRRSNLDVGIQYLRAFNTGLL